MLALLLLAAQGGNESQVSQIARTFGVDWTHPVGQHALEIEFVKASLATCRGTTASATFRVSHEGKGGTSTTDDWSLVQEAGSSDSERDSFSMNRMFICKASILAITIPLSALAGGVIEPQASACDAWQGFAPVIGRVEDWRHGSLATFCSWPTTRVSCDE